MERQARRWVWLALVILVWAIGVSAEEAEKPRFSVVAEHDIIPEKMETYMAARIAEAKLHAEHKFEFPYLTFVQNFRVTRVYYFTAFAQLDGVTQMIEQWNAKTGGRSEQLDKQAMSCVDRVSTWVDVARPDLSYWPKEPAFMPDFSQPYYITGTVYHIKPGKYEEAVAVAKKVKELSDKSQSPMAYGMSECIFGSDCAAFIGVAFAKDKAAFATLEKKMEQNPNPEIEKLMNDNVHLVRRIETMEGTFVPEASYVPEGTF